MKGHGNKGGAHVKGGDTRGTMASHAYRLAFLILALLSTAFIY